MGVHFVYFLRASAGFIRPKVIAIDAQGYLRQEGFRAPWYFRIRVKFKIIPIRTTARVTYGDWNVASRPANMVKEVVLSGLANFVGRFDASIAFPVDHHEICAVFAKHLVHSSPLVCAYRERHHESRTIYTVRPNP